MGRILKSLKKRMVVCSQCLQLVKFINCIDIVSKISGEVRKRCLACVDRIEEAEAQRLRHSVYAPRSGKAWRSTVVDRRAHKQELLRKKRNG